ncbi:hypothetical protein E2C06_29020 [Dankookia rubra]|uniref:Uncharacterized protein n=1 Tax=Dankookia rubra TaxID=1442381 RepID=A0A4R5Q8L6_9PROT|nr:hypothetical protein [Dankookia rubra]TDH59106.1 hypothetical protein E2C06_29020 [Dankookia rubra]
MHHQARHSSCHHPWWLPVLGLAIVVPSLALGAPALEYGPEAEARFRMSCEASGAAPRDCQIFMEALQSHLGYAAFLETAAMDPTFETLAGKLPRPAPLRLARQP